MTRIPEVALINCRTKPSSHRVATDQVVPFSTCTPLARLTYENPLVLVNSSS